MSALRVGGGADAAEGKAVLVTVRRGKTNPRRGRRSGDVRRRRPRDPVPDDRIRAALFAGDGARFDDRSQGPAGGERP